MIINFIYTGMKNKNNHVGKPKSKDNQTELPFTRYADLDCLKAPLNCFIITNMYNCIVGCKMKSTLHARDSEVKSGTLRVANI